MRGDRAKNWNGLLALALSRPVNLFQFAAVFLHRIIYKRLQSNRSGRGLTQNDINEFGAERTSERGSERANARAGQRELARVRANERAIVTVLASQPPK